MCPEQQKEPLQKDAERANQLEAQLSAATAEVAELHEALRELGSSRAVKKAKLTGCFNALSDFATSARR